VVQPQRGWSWPPCPANTWPRSSPRPNTASNLSATPTTWRTHSCATAATVTCEYRLNVMPIWLCPSSSLPPSPATRAPPPATSARSGSPGCGWAGGGRRSPPRPGRCGLPHAAEGLAQWLATLAACASGRCWTLPASGSAPSLVQAQPQPTKASLPPDGVAGRELALDQQALRVTGEATVAAGAAGISWAARSHRVGGYTTSGSGPVGRRRAR
jgi:hypothetical protein